MRAFLHPFVPWADNEPEHAVMLTWFASFTAPLATQQAAARQDYGNIFTFWIIA